MSNQTPSHHGSCRHGIIPLLTCLLLLPACRLGATPFNIHNRVEACLNGGAYEDMDFHDVTHWAVTKDKVYEYVDASGGLAYYIPISLSITANDEPWLHYMYGNWSSRHLLDDTYWSLGDHTERQLKEKNINTPLYRYDDGAGNNTQTLLEQLAILPAKNASISDIYLKSVEQGDTPSSLTLQRVIPFPHLQERLKQLDFNPESYQYITPINVATSIVTKGVTLTVDLPLTIVGTGLAMVYENTIGLVLEALAGDEAE